MSRKHDNKLPFSQKLFYLDVTTNLTLKTKIEFCVKQLGGVSLRVLLKKSKRNAYWYQLLSHRSVDTPADDSSIVDLNTCQ